MAYLEKRVTSKGVRYRAHVRIKGSPRLSSTHLSKPAARDWAIQVEAELRMERGLKAKSGRINTFYDAMTRYLRDVAPRTPKSYEYKRTALSVWNKYLCTLPLEDIDHVVISQVRDKIQRRKTPSGKPKSNTTVNRYLAAISHLLTTAAIEWGWIQASPMPRVTKFKEPRGRVRFLSENERLRLLEACNESRNHLLYTIVVVALSTGMRKSEILNLRWQDIDFKRSRIIIEDTKNGERRGVPLVGRARELVFKLSQSGTVQKFVFTGPNNTRFHDLKIAWEGAIKRSGISDFRFHDLRHCTASYLAMNGATSHEIAEVLGHKSLDMVKRYAHLCDSHV